MRQLWYRLRFALKKHRLHNQSALCIHKFCQNLLSKKVLKGVWGKLSQKFSPQKSPPQENPRPRAPTIVLSHRKKMKKRNIFFKKGLTNAGGFAIIYESQDIAGMAQLVEHVIGNDEVISSTLIASSKRPHCNRGEAFLCFLPSPTKKNFQHFS